VAADSIELALAAIAPEPERARMLAASLGGGLKTARTLARKGFSEESIEAALPGVAEEGR
jgi:hypothetical protein